VSIIIPLYNYEKYIEDCLESCWSQTYKEVELIIIDDASKDNSTEVVQYFADMWANIHLIKLPVNKGYSHAKNVGILASKGDFIVHLDADDMLTPKSIELRMRMFQAKPHLDMVHGDAYRCHGAVSYRWCVEHRKQLKVNVRPIHAQGVMIRKSVYEKYGLYFEKLRSKGDKEMWYRLGIHPKSPLKKLIRVKKIKGAMAFYRRHKKAMKKRRAHNPKYNARVERKFARRIRELKRNGITKKNTRMV
jgi:glycosyltransferase involved in cell wall biosynthesis